ncbi:class IV lanthionine synthetase LanL [Streptomyces sp. NPDC056503]|uniref:class IV lanthionine synthetase LanL n=1 Tax=Streptomyces sp. NPDC056503 TaxID=3345842 RepID=UPI003699BCA8
MTSHATEAVLEDLLHRALLATDTGECWTTESDDMWCRVAPRDGDRRPQGWKLHVSATAASAPTVLLKALEVLLRDASGFKFARSLERVGALNSRATPRGSSGKFLTVYPRSDADAARLAAELHRATAGLAGPRILSDQQYAADSLVHYRYGAFVGRRRLSDDGLLVWYFEDPDGNPVEDRRTGRYTPPEWAVSPFPAPAAVPSPGPVPAASRPLVVGGRFSVREAIRHTNKGGVYRGSDVRTGAPVVIKETRPHVEADASGCDVRDWLRAEARTLEKLRGSGLAPEPLALFEHGGHLFLAQEEVPGVPLRTWVAERFRDVGDERYRAEATAQVARLVDLVAAAHARGCVLRDFTPGNVMVRPDGELRLIDLELAVLEDDAALPTRVGTPGFSAPERLRDAPVSPTADYYSLGATLCFVLAGKVPNLLAEEPADRPAEARLAEWLDACAVSVRLPDGTREAILGLMRDDPAARWDPARARKALGPTDAAPAPTRAGAPAGAVEPVAAAGTGTVGSVTGTAAGSAGTAAGTDAVESVVAGIVRHLLDTMTPGDERRLWPVSTTAGETDPCTVQQGAAGVLAVLTRYFELTGDPRLPGPLSTAGRWIADRTDPRSARPGLHFGTGGTAWALYEAGRAVGDRSLVDHALTLALAPQRPTPSHDITHGTAGSGTAAVHLWRRTGDPRLAALVADAADRLAGAARREASGATWPVPAEAVAEEAGKRYLGFAHGSSGIGCFLLAAASVTGRPVHRELAVAAGEHLVAHAADVGGAVQWPAQTGNPPTAPYWCHGSAGIGSFLLRLWRATGDDRYGDLARGAARAVVERASRAALTQCHGLAGNGDFLLDLAEATGDPAHRARAEELARLLVAERSHRGGHVVFPNEYGDVSTGWSDGSAGILAFLLRVRHTEPRHWMVQLPV